LSDRQIRLADLSVRAEQSVAAVRILHFDTGEAVPFEISAEASDLHKIAAVLAGKKSIAEPADRRSWHDPVLAQKYPRFECVVRLISRDETTFVFVTNHGQYMVRFREELLPDLAALLTRRADWAKSS
jgi:hypothetical protein